MDDQDRQAIEELFVRLSQVERQTGPRDPAAEAFIRARTAEQPGAPYYMAQTIVVQEQALNAAQARIEALERQLASRSTGGGLLSGLFGGSRPQQLQRYGAGYNHGGTQLWGAPAVSRESGFLAGAAQTAMGVAGGLILGSMLADAFSSDEASAVETEDAATDEDPGFGSDEF